MKLTKFIDASGQVRVARVEADQLFPLELSPPFTSLADLLAAHDPIATVSSLDADDPVPFSELAGPSGELAGPSGELAGGLSHARWLPPIDHQEVWAAGVTYQRSQSARMEESEAAASCYDRVYRAARPELFFKATPNRVSGHLGPLRIRQDSRWNVPEPEVTLVLSPDMKIVGLTCGNDMSSRDIEGENPLYLPQAKCYAQCAGLGPWVTLYDSLPEPDQIGIDLKIERDGQIAFDQQTSAAQMARGFEDLVGWLARDNRFPDGAFLMTGTGIVPTNDFTLLPGDVVRITVDGVGTLSNPIVQGE